MHEADFYIKLKNNIVKCELCPWFCELKPGQTGNCKVRKNEKGTLITRVYNRVSALALDPIEKKPLYHFFPGSQILSLGSVGCNLHCLFCQNHHISQCSAESFSHFREITAEQLVETATGIKGNTGIAFTYNEPFTFFEFMFVTAKQAHEKGLKNVVVSNGYINPDPLKKILPFIDGFNIDLKSFNPAFYKTQTKGELAPVLEALKMIVAGKVHLEITHLVIPSLNDNRTEFENMINWIASELGNKIPLHLSRYFPQYKLTEPPTPSKTLDEFHEIASKRLLYVYTGNVPETGNSSTYCAKCGALMIERNRYNVRMRNIGENGHCNKCDNQIDMIFS